MNLLEHQGLSLFAKCGIAQPKAVLLTGKNTRQWRACLARIKSAKIVLKAQIPLGKRGKRGGVLIVPRKNALESAKKLRAKVIGAQRVASVLAEEFVEHSAEWYLGLAIDRSNGSLRLMFSEKGGVDIEDVARRSPSSVVSVLMDAWDKRKVRCLFALRKEEMTALAKKVWDCAHRFEATLVEINPVMVTRQKIIAGDSKVVVDDNALFRHRELQAYVGADVESREGQAKKFGLHYVELGGSIGIIGCGAGMVMATLDIVDYFGGKPANFLDVGGGASKNNMMHALQIVAGHPHLKGVFVNIFGGITHCDEIAWGIVEFRKKFRRRLPIVVRMIGTREEEGRAILEKHGIHCIGSMEDGARKIVQLVNRR